MEKSKKPLLGVWITFLIYMILYFAICIITKEQSFLWLLLNVYSLGISIFLLVKHKFPKKQAMVAPVIFSLLYLLSSIYNLNLYTIISMIIVLLSSCAVVSTFTNVMNSEFGWVKKRKKYDWLLSIFLGVLIGLVWGGINYFLMVGSNEKVPTDFLRAGIVALNPAVMEEISARTIFYAMCVHAMKGFPHNKREEFSCLFMMTIPHILPHILFALSRNVLEVCIEFIITLILYIVVFGLVFALLQRKRDVLTAMIAHGVVDAVRFVIFGLPF